MPGDLDQMPETLGHQQARAPRTYAPAPRWWPWSCRAGCGPISVRAPPAAPSTSSMPLSRPRLGSAGVLGVLIGELIAGLLVEGDHVGERAAGIDGYAKRHDSTAISTLYPLPGDDIVTPVHRRQTHAPRRRCRVRPRAFPLRQQVGRIHHQPHMDRDHLEGRLLHLVIGAAHQVAGARRRGSRGCWRRTRRSARSNR